MKIEMQTPPKFIGFGVFGDWGLKRIAIAFLFVLLEIDWSDE